MSTRAQLTDHYRSLVADLGPYAEAFNLHPDAQVTATSSAKADEPTLVAGPVAMYRTDGLIYVHRQLPEHPGAELVFIFRPRADGPPELLHEPALLVGGGRPDVHAN